MDGDDDPYRHLDGGAARWSGTTLTVLSGDPTAISAITRITIPERHMDDRACGGRGRS